MLDYLKSLFVRLTSKDEEGQGMVEYALILVLVSIVVIVALALLGPQITNIFTEVATTLGNRPSP